MLNYLKCSDDEHKAALVNKRFKWNYGYGSEFSTQSFTITSDMTPESPSSYINSEDLYS